MQERERLSVDQLQQTVQPGRTYANASAPTQDSAKDQSEDATLHRSGPAGLYVHSLLSEKRAARDPSRIVRG